MYNKVDQHSSSSCKGTSELLHIMRSNKMIFAVSKALLNNVALTLCYKLMSFFYIDFLMTRRTILTVDDGLCCLTEQAASLQLLQ